MNDKVEKGRTNLESSGNSSFNQSLMDLYFAKKGKLQPLLDSIVERATALLEAEGGGMYLFNPDQEQATCVVSYNTKKDYTGLTLKLGEGAAGKVLETDEPLIIDDYRNWNGQAKVFQQDRPFSAVLSVPISWDDRTIGVIHVLDEVEKRTFNKKDLAILDLFADQAAVNLKNLQLYEQSQQELKKRKRAEGKLAKSEQKYRLLAENIRDVIFVQDMDLHLAYVSPSAEKLTGYSIEELMNMEMSDYMTPESYEKAIELFQKYSSMARKDPTFEVPTMEYEYVRKDGSTIIGEMKVKFLRDSRGELVGTQGVIRDITKRKRAQETYREIFNKVADAITIHEPETGKIVNVNEFACDLWGYSKEEFIGLDIGEITHTESPYTEERAKELITKAAQEGPQSFEWKDKKKDGSTFWAEVHLGSAKIQGKERVLAAVRDVTERKRTKVKLGESEKKYRDLAENATDVLAQIDLEGNFIYMSKSAEQETGYTREEIEKLNIEDVLTPQSFRKSMERIKEWMGGAEDLPPYEVKIEAKDGRIVPFELNTSPIYEDNKLKAIHIIARNISERKQAQQELKKSHKQLEKALEGTVNALANTLEQRDAYTASHQKRVTQLALAIAEEMELPEERIEGLRVAGKVHDIGKINIPAEILSKPTELGDTEMDLVKAHAQNGYEILKDIDFPWPVADIVHQHHERLDGSGYPNGLEDEEIRLGAKILGVADVVEAMSAHRPYRPAKGLDKALEGIEQNKGVLYDPRVVETCVNLFEEGFEFKEGGEEE